MLKAVLDKSLVSINQLHCYNQISCHKNRQCMCVDVGRRGVTNLKS